MNKTARSVQLVSAIAVAAVSLAALAAVATGWVGQGEPERDAAGGVQASQRPAADQPVQVAKAAGAWL